MKKTKPGSASSDKPSSRSPTLQHSDKHKGAQDSAGFVTSRKISAGEKEKGGKPLGSGKPFLSKSQDNLASQLRRKAAAAALQKEAANKENVKDKATPSTPKGRPPKSVATPVTSKSNSVKPTDNTATPIKRAQSAQNITKAPATQPVGNGEEPVKRAASTQNISREKGGVKQVRISGSANIMAYNAELLASFEKEKKSLERRISELTHLAETRKTEIEKFKFEVKHLKERVPTLNLAEELEMLRNENRSLKERLHELGVSVEHITDTEKLSLLHKGSPSTESETHCALGSLDNGYPSSSCKGEGGTEFGSNIDRDFGISVSDFCITPDHPSSLSLDNSNWDKQSNKSSDAMSEVSVACLQDRILQMEETHYSTNEELQATLQELTDLQDAVNELQSENERLADERSVLLESLCAQTEKLENCRMQIEHLKALLVNESQGADRSENEKQLVALIKSAQEEREEFLLKQMELSNTLVHYENENKELQDIITALRDKTHILDMKNESLKADKRGLETQILEMKEASAKDHIEIQRYKTLLDNEKSKVAELEQFRNATDKSDLEELLDNARQEKERVEEKLTNVQEELAVSHNEAARLRELLGSLEEELKVCKNNAKTQVSDLDYKMTQISTEKSELQSEIDALRDHIDQLQVDCDRYLEEKKCHTSTVNELQGELKKNQQLVAEKQAEVDELQRRIRDEETEWRQFQSDLQTAVVIANDIRTETQEDMERIVAENSTLKERNNQLKEEISRVQAELEKGRMSKLRDEEKAKNTLATQKEMRGRVINTVDRELASLRQGRKVSEPWGPSQQQCLSVKNLIASIEQQVQCVRATPPVSPSSISEESSRRNSTDSSLSLGSLKSESPSKTPLSPVDRRSSVPTESQHLKSVLRKPAETKEPRAPLAHRHTITNIIYDKAPPVTDDGKASASAAVRGENDSNGKKQLTSILSNKSRKNSVNETDGGKQEKHMYGQHGIKQDPLAILAKQYGGSKRNALLKWCQQKTASYANIDITNFSSSWNDGLAFCAILHNYLPEKIPYKDLNTQDKMRNFTIAFKSAESVGIPSILNIGDMASIERPDWSAVMSYITSVYKHFEIDMKS